MTALKTTLFIPVRNEIEAVKVIMPKIRSEWVHEILVIDGDSTDGTREYLEQEGFRVVRQRSLGLLGAYWECLEIASGDVIIAFSPDGNSLPELIPRLIEKIDEGYDIVIASRYRDGAKSDDDGWVTAFGNWMFTRIINVLFGGHYTDVLVMYRAFRKDVVARLNIDPRRDRHLEMSLVIRALKQKLRVAEIPGDEPARISGTRKMKVGRNGLAVLAAILRERFAR